MAITTTRHKYTPSTVNNNYIPQSVGSLSWPLCLALMVAGSSDEQCSADNKTLESVSRAADSKNVITRSGAMLTWHNDDGCLVKGGLRLPND